MKRMIISLFILTSGIFLTLNLQANEAWPPQLNKPYPDTTDYYDQTGKVMKMSDLKGQVLFIEYVGMNCTACQAFSGANKKGIGSYQNSGAQDGLQSIEEYFNSYSGGINLSDKRVTYIAVLLYDMKLGAPKSEDAKKWAEHFHFSKKKREYVRTYSETRFAQRCQL